MLDAAANERMCRVGPRAAMGRAMRRYWLPVLPAHELAPAGDPHPLELLGERFVAWRDASGRPGLYADGCLHRGASMRLARAEPDGLRCIYHGWKFATDGAVLDTPNVADPRFKERIRGRVHAVHEAGGLLWAYLGPRELQPAFPHAPWMDLPASHRVITRHVEACNFVQVLEGLVDSSHLGLLHLNGLRKSGQADLTFARKVGSMRHELAPRMEVQDTDFGFWYAAIRQVPHDGTLRTEGRVAAFVAPCTVLNPNGDIATYVVPMDDQRTAFLHVFWSDKEALGAQPLRSRHLDFIGLAPPVLDAFGITDDTLDRADRPNARNNFLQDRTAMREDRSWSGLPGLIEEDVAVSVSAGPMRPREDEVLASADVGVARLYRTLLACADAVERGESPPGLRGGIDWACVAGRHGVLDERGWRGLLG